MNHSNPFQSSDSPLQASPHSSDGMICPCCQQRTTFWSNVVQIIPNRFKCQSCKTTIKHRHCGWYYYLVFGPTLLPIFWFERWSMGFIIYFSLYMVVGLIIYAAMLARFRTHRVLVKA